MATFVGLALLIVACENRKVGEACVTYRSEECGGPGGACLANSGSDGYCSHTCNGAPDCPNGFKCKDITSTSYNNKGEKTGEKKVKMCVKNAPAI